jgi:hypothetical protein
MGVASSSDQEYPGKPDCVWMSCDCRQLEYSESRALTTGATKSIFRVDGFVADGNLWRPREVRPAYDVAHLYQGVR